MMPESEATSRLKQVITDAQTVGAHTRLTTTAEVKAMYDLLRDIETIVDRSATACQLGQRIAQLFGKELKG